MGERSSRVRKLAADGLGFPAAKLDTARIEAATSDGDLSSHGARASYGWRRGLRGSEIAWQVRAVLDNAR
jgi:hypothetical protein